MASTAETLRKELISTRKSSRGSPHNRFYTRLDLASIITDARIRDILSQLPGLNERDVRTYATLIMDTAFLIFAILLSNGHELFILRFVFRRDNDNRIPFSEPSLDYLPPEVCESFVNKQWQFSPVVFDTNEPHRDLDSNAVLPIMSETCVGTGGFGTVWKISLDARCQRLLDGHTKKEVLLARKELEKGTSGSVERAVLDLVRTLKHPNIVEFLGSYRHMGHVNLLFPLATMNLHTFLSNGEHAMMERRKIYAGIYGLADALSKIHNFSFQDGHVKISNIGYHHDLRPANILVDLDRGVMMIADFGLSRLKNDDQTSKTRLHGGQDDYLGPESFDYSNWTNGEVGRPLDVWAFGCIVAEVATFIEGRDTTTFRDKRKDTHAGLRPITDHAFHLNSLVRPSVERWLDDIVRQPRDPLVVPLVDLGRCMMNPHPHRRVKISEVVPKLKLLAIRSAACAIDELFTTLLSSSEQGPPSRWLILCLLEFKRVQAWRTVYDHLHEAVRMELKGDVLLHLTKLHETLDTHSRRELGSISESLPPDLLSAVDHLCQTLPDHSLQEFRDRWAQNVCEIGDMKVLEEIRTMAMPGRYRLVGVGAAMKHMSMSISMSIQYGEKSRYIDSGIIEPESAPFPLVDASKSIGYITHGKTRQAVLIEWKVYDASWKGREPQLKKLMDDLVNLLDPNVTPRVGAAQHRVPSCLGYFHESRNFRFGFVYAVPDHLRSEGVQLLSLNNVLRLFTEDDDSEEIEQPNLGDLFLVAKDLAECLLAVHQASWLHKNLSSHHILVFCPDRRSAGQYIKHAMLSGFNDSRPEASSFTLGPRADFKLFRHPDYSPDIPFRKAFDYYGLGIVLLELGLSQTISNLRDSHLDLPGGEPFRLKLLQSYVPQLGPVMGVKYRDAVEFCLDTERMLEARGHRAGDDDTMQLMFREKVVDSLALCVA